MIKWIKKVSGWSSVGTIFKARMEQLGGLIMAGVASVSAFSFLPYLTDTINWKVLLAIGAYMFITGVVGEIVRKANAKDV
jgi:hypothetical protein